MYRPNDNSEVAYFVGLLVLSNNYTLPYYTSSIHRNHLFLFIHLIFHITQQTYVSTALNKQDWKSVIIDAMHLICDDATETGPQRRGCNCGTVRAPSSPTTAAVWMGGWPPV